MDVEKRIAQYLQIREIMRVKQKVWDDEKAKLTNLLDRIEGELGVFLKDTNQKNLATKSGTCYTSEVWSATVADGDALRNYIKETGQMELLKLAANPTAVRAFVDKNRCLPPGVNLTSHINVNVRKSKEAVAGAGNATEGETPNE